MSSSASESSPTSALPAQTYDDALKAALEVAGWPSSLVCASKRPTILPDLAALVETLLYRSHVDEVFVLPNGVDLLGHADALPEELVRAARAPSVRTFLAELSEETMQTWRGRVYCSSADMRDERELKEHDGRPLDRLLDKARVLPAAHPEGGVYIGEIRKAEKYRHALDNRWVKTVLRRDVKDYLGRERSEGMPYWDRFDEGVFCGGRFGGSPLHVDQVSWSNVGKSFCGSKLLAIWPQGEASRTMFDEHNYQLFVPPLAESEARALEGACRVALLQPRDVVIFSGGNAHMALSISSELSLTAYESFIGLDPANLRLFLQSGTAAQYRQCRARAAMMEDIKLEVAENIADLIADIDGGHVEDPDLKRHLPAALAVLQSDEYMARQLKRLTTAPPPAKQPRLDKAVEPTPPQSGPASPSPSAAATAAVPTPSPPSSSTP